MYIAADMRGVIIAFFVTITSVAWAQETSSTLIGVQFGPSKYIGDIGVNPTLFDKLTPNQNSFFTGAHLMFLNKQRLGLQIAINAGTLRNSDKSIHYTSSSDPNYILYLRNLDFKTNIVEWSVSGYIYPFKYLQASNRLAKAAWQPYLTAGIASFKFNPIGSYYDEIANQTYDVELAPLHTEGQGFTEFPERKPYQLRQFNIPMGLGVSYTKSNDWLFSFEVNTRKLFTDYLDDVSKDYINPNYFDNNLSPDDAIIAKYMSRKNDSHLLDNTNRGDNKKFDTYFTYAIKIQFKIKQKGLKQQSIYRYDDIELCF